MKSKFKQIALRSSVAIACAAAAVAASAAEGTATASATVVAPIGITQQSNLNFGSFLPAAGGSITVSTMGAVTPTGIVRTTLVPATAAAFLVSGDGNSAYSINYVGTSTALVHTVDGTQSMAFTHFSALDNGDVTTGTVAAGTLVDGSQTIRVGGTLTVAANQLVGSYLGSIKVQVEYN
jgi:hypothetical protein